MVPGFCRLNLPQPSNGFIKTLQDFYQMHFCTQFYNVVILKISACTIMLGFCKSGHICGTKSASNRFQSSCMHLPCHHMDK